MLSAFGSLMSSAAWVAAVLPPATSRRGQRQTGETPRVAQAFQQYTDGSHRVGCVALRAQGGLVAALASNSDHSGGQICALTLREDASDAECETELATLPLESSCPNDGAVDAAGRCVRVLHGTLGGC